MRNEDDEEERVALLKKIAEQLRRKRRIFSKPDPSGWAGICADCGKPEKWCECE